MIKVGTTHHDQQIATQRRSQSIIVQHNDLRTITNGYQFFVAQTHFASFIFARLDEQRKYVFCFIIKRRRVDGLSPLLDLRIHECPHSIVRLTGTANPVDWWKVNDLLNPMRLIKEIPWQWQLPSPLRSCNRKGSCMRYNPEALLN